MSRLTRDGTTEPVSRDQILRRVRGPNNISFSLFSRPRAGLTTFTVNSYSAICDDHTYIHTVIHTFSTDYIDRLYLVSEQIIYFLVRTCLLSWVGSYVYLPYTYKAINGKVFNRLGLHDGGFLPSIFFLDPMRLQHPYWGTRD